MKIDVFGLILSLLKSFVFNIRMFGVCQGIRVPVLVSYRCNIQIQNGGRIIIPQNARFGLIKIGLNKGHFDRGNKDTSYLRVSDGGTLVFKGKANFAVGSVINVVRSTVEIGKNFSTNDRFTLSSELGMVIADDVMVGWNCTFIDGDGHNIYCTRTEEIVNKPKSIYIGKNTWIASGVTLMKGTSLASHTVVALGSIVTKKFIEENTVIAGNPACVVKKNVKWMENFYDKELG